MGGNREEALEKVANSLISGKIELCKQSTQEALDSGIDAYDILMEGCKAGMDVVGEQYQNRSIFLPNVLTSAQAMYAAMDILKPHLEASQDNSGGVGIVVIGTVEGDLHDIGKNIVRILLDGMAFDVHDLGRDVSAKAFLEEVDKSNADVLGMSTLMSTTLRSMDDIHKALNEKGYRDKVKTIIGGAATTAPFAEKIGADAWGKDANDGVSKIRVFCEARRS